MRNVILASGAGVLLATTSIFAIAQEAPAPSREGGYGLGRAALPEEVAAWDIDVRPDGEGLPVGSGDVWTGEEVFVAQCSACHGDFGEAVGRWPVLAGGFGTLDGEDPVKTVGSYWPYLSTVWDYVHRAMPYGSAQSLSDDDVYAITAYLMYLNNMVEDDFELSNENFTEVAMPNEGSFFMDDRDEAEVPQFTREPCMSDCREDVQITMRAAVLDVTPDTGQEEAVGETFVAAERDMTSDAGPDPALVAEGETVFRACAACHELGEGARNRVGPHLNGIVGMEVASHDGFRYSPALQQAGADGMVWTEDNLSAYLADPRGFLPGNRMAFRGLQSESEIEAVIAYIEAAGTME
ncbi:c-type cytochrome [Roseibacterium sp. SDUM158017]|uniref:c-type cytochrome n=1 Tax=Roseicyclus salinarum TaxID=3036773 RepID=UPI0024154553|nr:c-type cytochrome [Roseibacterium sp. SDUM158017]MDG4649377.1 c-type cytochrome [Roseibacterium sp. SDUM158017]